MAELKDNLFYVCTLIESIARQTNNHRSVVVDTLGLEGIRHQLDYADINHCLPIEQVTEEMIENYQILKGNFDTVTYCKYKIPSITAIGKVYQRLILDIHQKNETWEETIKKVFSSYISDEISNFNSAIYYSSPDYLKHSYLDGELLTY